MGIEEKPDLPPQDPTAEVSGFSANVRIPPFWRADPELWFCQVDAVFATSKITSSKIKFQLLVTNLDFEVLKQVSDLVKNPTEKPYEALKERLVHTYAESENQRIKRLLEDKHLSPGERPSQLLNELKRLAGSSVSNDLLRTMWLRALPDRMQATLAVTSETSVDKLAEVADRIAEVYEPSVHAVTTGPSTPSAPSSMAHIEELMRKMSLEISELRGQLAQRHNRGRSRDRPRSRSRSKGGKYCYFHQTFREKARKCRPPCEWKTTGN